MVETAEPTAKLELRPKMGLTESLLDKLPWLQIQTKSRKNGAPMSNVQARLLSLVISPDEHQILYLECLATSSSIAHAIMAAAVETSTSQQWAFCPTQREGYTIYPGSDMRIMDLRIALRGHSGLHHFALMSQETFLIASDQNQLWSKLRKLMGCPTLDSWKDALMPKVMASGCLLVCEKFGLPQGMDVYILDIDAEATFDRLCSEHVRERGL
jgi:hypothetical protein